MMKKFILILSLIFQTGFAHAVDFTGDYGNFRVIFAQSGMLTLVDKKLQKIYQVNIKTGEEAQLDSGFIYASRTPEILPYLQYLKGLRISGLQNASNGVDFVIKVDLNFSGEPQGQTDATLVFTATSNLFKGQTTCSYYYWDGDVYQPTQYQVAESRIDSQLHFDRVEAPYGGDALAGMTSVLVKSVFPEYGISSRISNASCW